MLCELCLSDGASIVGDTRWLELLCPTCSESKSRPESRWRLIVEWRRQKAFLKMVEAVASYGHGEL